MNSEELTNPQTPNSDPLLFDRTAILGLGLMGGSLGLAIRERGLSASVVGNARKSETREIALSMGIVDQAAEHVEDAVRGADLVVMATPLLSYESLLSAALPALSPGCIVTDLGSTKAQVVQTCEALLEGTGVTFIGGHPMTGSEESGPEAARPRLYEGAPWCLTPTAQTSQDALRKVRQLAEALGSHVVILSPEQHDVAVAASSHVPHLAAVALVGALQNVSHDVPAALQLIAGGFRDTTRVASGSPEMWRDICLSNREGILKAIGQFKKALSTLESATELGDAGELLEAFDQARLFREEVVKKE